MLLRMMRLTMLLLAVFCSRSEARIFGKCELAHVLETKHAMPREDVKHWVCTAEYESTFNTEAVNKYNWDKSYDYGLFQLNNKYWCDGHTGKNECRMPCSALLDDDLTDDLACIRKIIKDTERWKGKGTGLTAWVAYVKRCQFINLDEYISECYDGSHPIPPTTESQPIDNFIPRVPDITSSTVSVTPVSITTTTTTTSGTQDEPISDNEIDDGKPGSSLPESETDQSFVPSARIPYPSHQRVAVPESLRRRGSTAVHVSSARLPFLGRGASASPLSPVLIGKPVSFVRSGQGFSLMSFSMPVPPGNAAKSLFSGPVHASRSSVTNPNALGSHIKTIRQGFSPLGPSLTFYRHI